MLNLYQIWLQACGVTQGKDPDLLRQSAFGLV